MPIQLSPFDKGIADIPSAAAHAPSLCKMNRARHEPDQALRACRASRSPPVVSEHGSVGTDRRWRLPLGRLPRPLMNDLEDTCQRG